MGKMIRSLIKPIRTTAGIEIFLSVFNLLSNFIFLLILGIFVSFSADIWTMSLVDFWNIGLVGFLLYIPWLIIMLVIKGFIIEMIAPILVRWK